MTRLFCFVLSFLILFTTCQTSKVDVPDYSADIKAIKKGLTPGIQVKGEEVIKSSIEERMKFHKVPNLSVAVLKDGKIIWAEGFGLANSETGAKVDENTRFQAASISKPIAAFGALKLVQEGKLSLDEDFNNYLKSWKIPDTEFTKEEKVTLRRLVTHTAGITVHGFPGYAQKDTFPSDVQVLNGEGNTAAIFVDTFPGTINRYSGGGYTIMERAVEDISGQDFASYMQETVLAPLGMSRSTYEQPLSEAKQDNISIAYKGSGAIYEGLWHNYPEQAAAGLWTTPSDLLKYAFEVQESLKGNSNKVIKQELTKEMLTPDKFERGLGPGLGGKGKDQRFGHGGKNAGFTCNLTAFVHKGDGIAVMSGADNARPLLQEVERAVSDHFGWDYSKPRIIETIEVAEEEIAKRVGKFVFEPEDYEIEIVIEEGQLILIDPNEGDQRHTLIHTKAQQSMSKETGDRFQFKKEGELVSGFTWNNRFEFKRIDD